MTSLPGPDQPQLGLPDSAQTGPQLAMVLENDRKSMHLRIGKDGKLMAGIVLSAEMVDSLTAGLTQIRDRMLPEPPPVPVEAEPAQATPVEAPPSVPVPPEPPRLAAPELASPVPTPAEPAPTEYSAAASQQIKGTHYDFGIDENTQQLVFSVRDQSLGWLSFRFGVRLLERMLKVAKSAQKS